MLLNAQASRRSHGGPYSRTRTARSPDATRSEALTSSPSGAPTPRTSSATDAAQNARTSTASGTDSNPAGMASAPINQRISATRPYANADVADANTTSAHSR